MFGSRSATHQDRVLHILLFVNERLYALKLLRWHGSLPLSVIPPLVDSSWEPQHKSEAYIKRLILAYLLVAQMGHLILNGISMEGVVSQWQCLEPDTAKGLSWRGGGEQTFETRCLQYWLRAAVCPRARPLHDLRPTSEWRDVVVAILQDTFYLIVTAKYSGHGHCRALNFQHLCDIAFFGLDALSGLEAGWPDSAAEALKYIDQIVAETDGMMKQTPSVNSSLGEKLCDARSQITSIHVTQRALASCMPAHYALNEALLSSPIRINTIASSMSGPLTTETELIEHDQRELQRLEMSRRHMK